MGLPESTEQFRFAPVRALRTIFSGVGQLLLAADRLREEDAEHDGTAGREQQDSPKPWDPYEPRSVRIIPNTSNVPDSRVNVSDLSDEADVVPPEAAQAIAAQATTAPGKAKPTAQAKKPGGGKRGSGSKSGGAAKSAAGAVKSGGAAKSASAAKVASGGSGRNGRKHGANQAQQPRFRSLDLTGNVRLLSADDLAENEEDEFARTEATAPSEPSAVTAGVPAEWPYGLPAAESAPAPAPAAQDGDSSDSTSYPAYPTRAARELPIEGYDGLSLPSLRARLRNLDVAQLRQLVLYEISHAYRPDVVSMFERRIARLQGSES